MSSHFDVTNAVIFSEKQKSPAGGLMTPVGVAVGFLSQLEQIKFLGSVDSRPACFDPQLIENAFGVGAKGVERDD